MLTFELVGIGNPVYDTIITPLVKTPGRVLSGCSTNACLAAKKLGVKKVGLVGCIGQDFAHRFRVDMERYGIEASIDATGKETGGFHLVLTPAKEIRRVAGILHDTLKVDRVAPGHCTSEPGFAVFMETFKDHFDAAGLGTVIPLPS